MSTGLKLIGGQPYVSRKLVLKHGVPLGTTKDWSTCKRVEKLSLESGLHYRYETLPPKARARLPFASADDARRVALSALAAADVQQQQEEAQGRESQLAYDSRHTVETTWLHYKQAFVLKLGMTDAGHAAAEPLARLQAALEWCLDARSQGHKLHELLPAFQALRLAAYCPEDGARGGQSGQSAYASFSRKLSEYSQAPSKVAYLLAKRGAPRGNSNSRKVQRAQINWLVAHYRGSDKPTLEQVCEAYQDAAKRHSDWPATLGVRTIGNLMKEHKPAWFEARHGKAAAQKELGYKLLKKRPSVPDMLLEFDGTTLPLTFTTPAGQEVRTLYVLWLWDMHSDCIVGSAYGFSETADLVLAALQDYFTRWGRVPRQFRFDKGAANTSKRVQAVLEKTGAIAFPSEAGRPTGRRSEQLTGLFQKTVLRKLPWWRGPNITSNANLDLQANPERLAAAQKQRLTVAEMVAVCRACEGEWNARRPGPRAADRRAPLERYQAGEETSAKLTLGDLANLLYVKRQRPVTFTSSGLKLEVAGVDYAFEPQQADLSPDLAACNAANGHAFEVWEAQDGSREQVLVRRADGKGDWQAMGRKYAYSESLLELLPGDAGHRLATLASDKTLRAELAATTPDLEPADALHLAELGHTGLPKDAWNAVNAAAEMARARPVVSSSLKRAAAAAPVAHPSLCGADWYGGPTEGPPPSLEILT